MRGESVGHAGAKLSYQRPMSIGLLQESELHAALKRRYANNNTAFEVSLDGYVIDLVQRKPGGDVTRLIEVQTGNFGNMRAKLRVLVERYPIHLIHPIAVDTWLVMHDKKDGVVSRRKSPAHGGYEHIFAELIAFPDLINHKNFTLEVVLTREDEWRVPLATPKKKRRWRAKSWRSIGRHLLEVLDWQVFECGADLLSLLPADLPSEFTTPELMKVWRSPRWLAQRAVYCLRKCGAIEQIGKRGNAFVYGRPATHVRADL